MLTRKKLDEQIVSWTLQLHRERKKFNTADSDERRAFASRQIEIVEAHLGRLERLTERL